MPGMHCPAALVHRPFCKCIWRFEPIGNCDRGRGFSDPECLFSSWAHFSNYVFILLSTTLFTGMTGISLHRAMASGKIWAAYYFVNWADEWSNHVWYRPHDHVRVRQIHWPPRKIGFRSFADLVGFDMYELWQMPSPFLRNYVYFMLRVLQPRSFQAVATAAALLQICRGWKSTCKPKRKFNVIMLVHTYVQGTGIYGLGSNKVQHRTVGPTKWFTLGKVRLL
jgi:hypothetical protein